MFKSFKLKSNWRGLTVAVLAILFFLGASAYNFYTQSPDFLKWNSPDETANYLMSKQLALTGQPRLLEPDNLIANNLLVPRSMLVNNIWQEPVSFLGIIIWSGSLAKIFGLGVIPYLTPFLAGLALIFYYLLIKKLFNERTAFVATVLLASFPIYIYYSARSMFHNVPFVAWLIIGLYFSVLTGNKEKNDQAVISFKTRLWLWFLALISGLTCGFAATMRTSELIWLGPLLLWLWLYNLKRWKLMKTLLFIYGFLMAFVPVFYFNDILYGSPLASGYQDLNASVNTIVSSSGQLVTNSNQIITILKKIYHNFFYFGFKPDQSWTVFQGYFVNMFPWLWYLGLIGLIFFCVQFWRRRQTDLAYLISLLIISLILIYYYGSWQFKDNISPSDFTIGNAYTRYWLPIYLVVLPLVSLAILKLSRLFIKPLYIKGAQIIIVSCIIASSLVFVLLGSEEGLIPTHYRQLESRQEYQKVLSLTEANSIIITHYHDKLLFPERRVVIGYFNNQKTNAQYVNLVKRWPVYYYNFTINPDLLITINNEQLAPIGLELYFKEKVTSEFSLYILKQKK